MKSLALVITLLFSSFTYAHHTEQFFQAAKRETIVTPFASYSTGLGDYDVSVFRLGSAIERGFSDTISFGGRLSLSSIDAGSSVSGLDEARVYTKGHQNSGLNWGAFLDISTEDKAESVQHGAMGYGAYIGFELEGDSGFKFSYQDYAKDSSGDIPASEVEIKGFHESQWKELFIGYEAGLVIISKTTVADSKVDNAMNLIRLGAYPVWKIKDADIIGNFSYDHIVTSDLDQSGGILNLGVTYRRAL